MFWLSKSHPSLYSLYLCSGIFLRCILLWDITCGVSLPVQREKKKKHQLSDCLEDRNVYQFVLNTMGCELIMLVYTWDQLEMLFWDVSIDASQRLSSRFIRNYNPLCLKVTLFSNRVIVVYTYQLIDAIGCVVQVFHPLRHHDSLPWIQTMVMIIYPSECEGGTKHAHIIYRTLQLLLLSLQRSIYIYIYI